jgi:hypothetical protein
MQHKAVMLSKREVQVRQLGAGAVAGFQAVADSAGALQRCSASTASHISIWCGLRSLLSAGERLALCADMVGAIRDWPSKIDLLMLTQGHSQAGAAQEGWVAWKTKQDPEQQATMANCPGAQRSSPLLSDPHNLEDCHAATCGREWVGCANGAYDGVDWSAVQFGN